MAIIGYVLFALAFGCYLRLMQVIWRLVAESNEASPESRFSRFWWIPAWRFHRKTFPESGLRKQVILFYLITCNLGAAGFAIFVYQRIEQLRIKPF